MVLLYPTLSSKTEVSADSAKQAPNIEKKLSVLWPDNAENTIFWGKKTDYKNSSKKAEKAVDKGLEDSYNTNCSAPFGGRH